MVRFQWHSRPTPSNARAALRRRCYNNETCYERAQGDAMLASSKSWDKGVKARALATPHHPQGCHPRLRRADRRPRCAARS